MVADPQQPSLSFDPPQPVGSNEPDIEITIAPDGTVADIDQSDQHVVRVRPDVPAIDDAAIGTMLSLRQQMEKHRSNPICASCHSKMDPLGFALENYDAIGKWREQDGKFAVDSSGTLPDGKTFNGPAAMRDVLAERMPDFARNLVEKMMMYSIGRGITPSDRRSIRQIESKWTANGLKFQTLIYEVAHSAPFQSRRGETLESGNTRHKEVAAK